MFIALDGNFQLHRRKANAEDNIKAESGLFFTADKLQDKYAEVQAAPCNNNCESDFKAADLAITSRHKSKFPETGIIGSACARHGTPLVFTNIFLSGERYQYYFSILMYDTKADIYTED